MKKNIAVLLTSFFIISTLFAQYPDTIIVSTNKVKGFGPFQVSLDFVDELSKDNPWITTVPTYKGIPTDLHHLMFATVQTDFLQHTYQNYILGKVSEERLNELKQAWNWHPVGAEYSKDFIKVDIGIVAGYDSSGTLLIKVDKNNNYDFSDDEYFTLPEKLPGQNFWGRYNDLLPFKAEYEFFDGEKKTTNAWVYLDYPPYRNMDSEKIITPIQLSFAFAQHQIGEFELSGKKYAIAIKSDRAVYRDYYSAKVWNDDTKNTLSNFDEGVKKNSDVKLGDYYYKLGKVNIDGSQIILTKDLSVDLRGGNEVGMKAIEFSAISITGEKIELKKLRGKLVLLDFWGTWCTPCREEIPNLKSIYERFRNKNFEIIGIANDKMEPLSKFGNENGLEWPQILQEKDKSIITDYNVVGYPTLILIDVDGEIISKGLRGAELFDKITEILEPK